MIKYAVIVSLMICAYSQWTITHYEGYDKPFTQHNSDNYVKLHCDAYNIPIIAQQGSLQKVISLNGFKPFAKTKILLEYLVPINTHYEILIQNKKINPYEYHQIGYGFSMINQCFNTSDYQVLSLDYELEGKNYTEISINIQLHEFRLQEENDEQDQQAVNLKYVGIKQIHIFQIQCPQNCKNCSMEQYDYDTPRCQKCEDGFTQQNQCYCSHFRYLNKCVTSCPQGYLPNIHSVCTQVDILDNQLITFNEKVQVQLNNKLVRSYQLTKSSKVQLEFEFIIDRYQPFVGIDIVVNDLYQGIIANYYDSLYISVFQIEESNCNNYSNCTKIIVQTPIIETNSTNLDILIMFKQLMVKQTSRQNSNVYANLDINSIKIIQLTAFKQACQSENCDECYTSDLVEQCSKCKDGLYKFQNQCVLECPKTTILDLINNQCKEIADKHFNSQLLVQDIGISQYDWAGDVSLLDKRSQFQYRFNSTNLLFGGKWNRQEFTKILILEPHYALTYQFTISYIDLDQQNIEAGFFYQLDGGDYVTISPNDLIQIDGDANAPDSIVHYSKYFTHKNDDIMITIGCNTNSYCFLQDYYLITHRCTAYCKQCTGPSKQECVEFKKNVYEFDSDNLKCRKGYYENEEYQCEKCQVAGCLECASKYQCVACQKNCKIHLQGNQCICE